MSSDTSDKYEAENRAETRYLAFCVAVSALALVAACLLTRVM